MSKGQQTPRAPKADPAQILEVALPRVLRTMERQARAVGATYVFNLSGAGGGTWTVDLHTVEVRRGGSESADVILDMSDEDFAAMTQGELDANTVISEGRVRIVGDPELLADLCQLMGG